MTDYPRMLYAADGRTLTVYSEHEENAQGAEWSRNPSDVHRNIRVHSDPTVEPVNEALAEAVAQRVFAMVKTLLEPEPARRGRPPKSDL